MTAPLIVRFDALRSLGFASISGTYATVGTPINHAVRLIKFQNTTNGNLTVSFDGTTDNEIIPAGGFALYDFGTNRREPDTSFVLQAGTQVYVKGSPSSGTFYITVIFGRGE